MLKACFSLTLTLSAIILVTNCQASPPTLKWYLTWASNNSFLDHRKTFLVSSSRCIQGQESESAKASSGCGPVWRCLVSAGRAQSDSLTLRVLFLWGHHHHLHRALILPLGMAAASPWYYFFQRALWGAAATRSYCCLNIPDSITCSGVFFHINCPKVYGALWETIKIFSLHLVFFLSKGRGCVSNSTEFLWKQLWWDEINI